MRIRNVAAAAAVVLAGSVGSITAAHAMALSSPLAADGGIETSYAATDLVVVYQAGPGTAASTSELRCNPTGGDRIDAVSACDRLAKLARAGRNPFATPSANQVCSVDYDGPETATVLGTWRGKQVRATFSRTNGCEIARWESISPLLDPAPGTHTAVRDN
ncbi:MAG TPA: SSI family serine proteinase inhibitor [Sporichthyaceae bacterium]